MENNSNFTIKYSDESTNESVIYDLMRIEEDVYDKKDRGQYDHIESRFKRNKEMFILLYDNDKIIGYLCYFPISKELHDNIIRAKDFYDDNINAEDVVAFDRENYIYLISIALYKKYQRIRLGEKMMESFFDIMRKRNKNNQHIIDVFASAISLAGENITKKFGFKLFKDMTSEYGYKLMHLEGDKI